MSVVEFAYGGIAGKMTELEIFTAGMRLAARLAGDSWNDSSRTVNQKTQAERTQYAIEVHAAQLTEERVMKLLREMLK